MNKIEYSETDLRDFVNSLKKNPLLKEENITESNANLYSQMAKSLEHCKKCTSLDECPNSLKGYIKRVEGAQLKVYPCRYLKNEEKINDEQNLCKTLFINEEILNCSLSDVSCDTQGKKKAYTASVNFLTNIKIQNTTGIYLYGEFGVGKTFILAALNHELSKIGKTTLFAYFPDLARYIKGIMYETEKLEKLIDELKKCDVLILDDFGAESETVWFRDEVLGPILNYRFMAKKPILVSSNLDPKGAYDHLSQTQTNSDNIKGGRVCRRLLSLCQTVIKVD